MDLRDIFQCLTLGADERSPETYDLLVIYYVSHKVIYAILQLYLDAKRNNNAPQNQSIRKPYELFKKQLMLGLQGTLD